jgi:hypothetical protein
MIFTDYYGNVIKEGTKVAFNYSGEVRIGTVISIKNVTRKGSKIDRYTGEHHICVKVEHSDNGAVSKVGKKNLVAI